MAMGPAPVAITGLSICNALGDDREAVRAALWAGRSGLAPTTVAVPFPTWTGPVRGELPELPAAIADRTTRSARIVMRMLLELEGALERLRARWAPGRIAVLMGTSTAGVDRTEVAWRRFRETGGLPADYDLWHHHTYGATLRVVQHLTGARGPAWMHSTACTSSAKPLASAQRLIASGVIDAAIVGGVDTLCAMTLTGFRELDALDAEPCRPFAEGRNGINIGEGGALLLIERGGEPMALVEGVGETSDAYHISAPHPQGAGAVAAMRGALAQAGVGPEAVHHINAHGTGTRLNDAAEAAAIAAVFGGEVPVVSTKGYTGHALGGAGAMEAAMATFALIEGWIPASCNAAPVDPELGIRVVTARETGRYTRVLSNSFAFGGNNVSVLLRAP